MDALRNHMGRLLFGLALAFAALAGEAAAKEHLLTEDSVSRFLASFAEMRGIAISEGLRTGTDSEVMKDPLAAVLKAIKSSKLKTEAEKIAVAHGFADLKDWSGTGRSIAEAYVYITSGPARGIARDTLKQSEDAAIAELEKLGIVTDKNKQKLKDSLDSVSDALAREPPPENTAIVKKMKPDIDRTLQFGLN